MKLHYHLIRFVLLFLISCPTLYSQPGKLDLSFNPDGFCGEGPDGEVRVHMVQPDGKILIGGLFSNYSGVESYGLVRILPNGAIDSAFNAGAGTGGIGYVYDIELQSDGKILVAGAFSSFNGINHRGIVRLNTDGSLDEVFNSGVGASNSVVAVKVLSNGKVLIGGFFTSYNGTNANRIARLNSDGSIDTTFVTGTGFDNYVSDIDMTSSGKLIVSGMFNTYNGSNYSKVAVLNEDGSVFSGFANSIGADAYVRDVLVMANGKILLGGDFNNYNGSEHKKLVRLNSDGTVDNTFVFPGASGSITTITEDAQGRLVIGGSFSSIGGDFAFHNVIRLNQDGSVDAAINAGIFNNVYCVRIDESQNILISGNFWIGFANGTYINKIMKVTSANTIDYSFNQFRGADQTVLSFAMQPEGKLLVGGEFERYDAQSRGKIARILPNGSLDPSFNPGTGCTGGNFGGEVSKILQQNDGRIIIAGEFTAYNGVPRRSLARINADGSLDESFEFNDNNPLNIFVDDVILLPSGKLIVSGRHISVPSGAGAPFIVKLNTDGSIDTSFTGSVNSGSIIWTMELQTDGKILIAGDFTIYNGTPRKQIARILEDGSLDLTFNHPNNVARITDIVIQTDGKVVYCTAWELKRLNTDGTIDNTFANSLSFAQYINALAIQNDGRILAAFDFNKGIIRVNTNGSVDTSFDPGTGTSSSISTIFLDPYERILIGGLFTSFDRTTRNHIARLNGDGVLDTHESIVDNGNAVIAPNPSNSDFKIYLDDIAPSLISYAVYTIEGKLLETKKSFSWKNEAFGSQYPLGIYVVRIQFGTNIKFAKIVKR